MEWAKIEMVQAMQDFIIQHVGDEKICLRALYQSIGYSQRHADRLFKELLHKTPREYWKALKLSATSAELASRGRNILDVALDSGFDSHEGYSRAFRKIFGVSPSVYRSGKCPIPLLIAYPIKEYYSHLDKKGEVTVDTTALCMITPVSRPRRKLMFLRSRRGHDSWSFCEEMCCDWEGLLNSIPAKYDTAAILTLPPFMARGGYSQIAAGVELPFHYDGQVPEGYEITELEPCEMLYFQSQPFETEEEFFSLIGQILRAPSQYNPQAYGLAYAYEIAPSFNFGGCGGKGAKIAVPVRRLL